MNNYISVCFYVKIYCILSGRWDFHKIDNLSVAVHTSTVAVAILLCGCTTLSKLKEKKLDRNYTWMLRAVLNKYKKLHHTKQHLYDHLPPILQTIQIRWTRHAKHVCWTKDKFISNIFLWTATHGCTRVSQPAMIYTHQLCANTGKRP